jgi:hypothetical protein
MGPLAMLWTASKVGQRRPLCPDISDINLFRYCQGIIYFDPRSGYARAKAERPFSIGWN